MARRALGYQKIRMFSALYQGYECATIEFTVPMSGYCSNVLTRWFCMASRQMLTHVYKSMFGNVSRSASLMSYRALVIAAEAFLVRPQACNTIGLVWHLHSSIMKPFCLCRIPSFTLQSFCHCSWKPHGAWKPTGGIHVR